MGGLALKNAITRRYQRDEFEVISKELMDTLKKDFKRFVMPLFYSNKQSFGDADIIVSTEGFDTDIRGYITNTFHPEEIFHNGNCWSFDYKELQVDLITVSAEDFDTNEMYLSYNDLGNFIGRIAQGFGLKYGQEGLWYEHYYKGMNIGQIPISKDYPTIFKFLGLSYERWEKGFAELEDIFEYIATSPYFNWEMFQLSRLNKINRERNIKRKSYMSFLEWMDKNVADDNHKFEFIKMSLDDRSAYVDTIDESFPEANLVTEIRRLEYEECKKLYIKAKFNGGDVMRKYGLEGKTLGDAMTGFKSYLVGRKKYADTLIGNVTLYGSDLDVYSDTIITLDVKDIYKHFEDYLETIKQTT